MHFAILSYFKERLWKQAMKDEADIVNVLERIQKCSCQLHALSKFYQADLAHPLVTPATPACPLTRADFLSHTYASGTSVHT